MAHKVDLRTKIEGKLFADIGPGGSLIFSSGYFDGIGEDDEIRTELIISPEGIRSLIDLLINRRRTRRAPDGSYYCEHCGSTDPGKHANFCPFA